MTVPTRSPCVAPFACAKSGRESKFSCLCCNHHWLPLLAGASAFLARTRFDPVSPELLLASREVAACY
jgi:hypothetical protein